jgi:hypothetical protein
MVRALSLLPSVLLVVAACSSDPPAAPSGPGTFGGGSSSGGSSKPTVDCTHPGAGTKLANGLCECETTLDVNGDWAASRTCRELDKCPVNAGDESIHITQSGTEVTASSATYKITGTLCGDTIVFSGGPTTSGAYKECGQIRFTDASHYVKDGCYVASGSCSITFASGCPSQKGQCTGIGAKKPAAAPAIVKDICL